jgi:hypothetical protein
MNHYSQRMEELNARPLPFRGDISEEMLLFAEQQLGYSLPTTYREFVRNYGGFMIGAAYPVKDPRKKQNGIPITEADIGVSYGLNLERVMNFFSIKLGDKTATKYFDCGWINVLRGLVVIICRRTCRKRPL